jgi:mannosyl-3-phosphoglycerate phosphatase
MSLIIFTGIDEVLSSTAQSDYQLITSVVQDLQQQNIPLIPVTSKTRAEIADWLERFDFIDPFIVERGSGIFIPEKNRRFTAFKTTHINRYHLHQLGCSYTEARAALKVVQEEINKILRGFGDLDEENIQSLIGGSLKEVRKAKAREFSEYFLTPSRLEIASLQQIAREYGYKILPGDNLSLILGLEAVEATAIQWLTNNFTANGSVIHTVGLGSTKQDLALLEAVQIPIVIPSPTGVDTCLSSKSWRVASNPGVKGWTEAIEQICRQYLEQSL